MNVISVRQLHLLRQRKCLINHLVSVPMALVPSADQLPTGLSPKRLAFPRSSHRPSMPLYSSPNLHRSLPRLLLLLVRRRRPLLQRASSSAPIVGGCPSDKTTEARCLPHQLCLTMTKTTLMIPTISFRVRIMVCTICIRQRV